MTPKNESGPPRRHAPEAEDVLDGEEDREAPLDRHEEAAVPVVNARDRVEAEGEYASEDRHDEGGVEQLARPGVVLEDDHVGLGAPSVARGRWTKRRHVWAGRRSGIGRGSTPKVANGGASELTFSRMSISIASRLGASIESIAAGRVE